MLRTDAESIRNQISLKSAVIELSQSPQWPAYSKALNAWATSKINQMLSIQEQDQSGAWVPLDRVDRDRDGYAREIRLLKEILNSPGKFANEIPEMEKQAKELENAADALEQVRERRHT